MTKQGEDLFKYANVTGHSVIEDSPKSLQNIPLLVKGHIIFLYN